MEYTDIERALHKILVEEIGGILKENTEMVGELDFETAETLMSDFQKLSDVLNNTLVSLYMAKEKRVYGSGIVYDAVNEMVVDLRSNIEFIKTKLEYYGR